MRTCIEELHNDLSGLSDCGSCNSKENGEYNNLQNLIFRHGFYHATREHVIQKFFQCKFDTG
jgi:hypothetical protein